MRLAGNYPSKTKNGKVELKILNQPEEQHRARYLTEGSRGSIKDSTGLGHPVVKLFGYNGSPVKLQCFIGHDKHIGVPHLFYQASKITGKNSSRCSANKVDGTAVISLDLTPENGMQTTIDCIGILKERNVDVEQKVLRMKSMNSIYSNSDCVNFPSKKRCAKCRLVFRAKIPNTNEILQVVSSSILCTQPVGTPEISKMSLSECKTSGGIELYIIGKNFLKDSKVIFKSENWCKIIEPDKEYLHSSHLICTIPAYDGPHQLGPFFNVSISIRSGGKYSDSHPFTYINNANKANSVNSRLFAASQPNPLTQKQLFMSMMPCNKIKCEETERSSKKFHSLPMDTSRYFSEDSMLSSDGSSVSENILASEDSCFPDQSNCFTSSPHSNDSLEMTNFLGRINVLNGSLNGNLPNNSNNDNAFDKHYDRSSNVSFTGEDSMMNSMKSDYGPNSNAELPVHTVKTVKSEHIYPISLIHSCDQVNLTPSQLMPPPPNPIPIQSKEETLTQSIETINSNPITPGPINSNSSALNQINSSSDLFNNSQLAPNNSSSMASTSMAPTPMITTSPMVTTAINPPMNPNQCIPSSQPVQSVGFKVGPTIMQASQINAMSQMSDNELIRLINENSSMINPIEFPDLF